MKDSTLEQISAQALMQHWSQTAQDAYDMFSTLNRPELNPVLVPPRQDSVHTGSGDAPGPAHAVQACGSALGERVQLQWQQVKGNRRGDGWAYSSLQRDRENKGNKHSV